MFIDPCLTASVSLQTSPFSDYEYILRADAKTFEWEYADILIIDTQVDCGAISVDFFNSEDESALDLNLFSDVRSDTNNFSIGPSQDVSKDEIYKVGLRSYFINYPDNFAESKPAFTITVTDPCKNPQSVTASSLDDKEYTIT